MLYLSLLNIYVLVGGKLELHPASRSENTCADKFLELNVEAFWKISSLNNDSKPLATTGAPLDSGNWPITADCRGRGKQTDS